MRIFSTEVDLNSRTEMIHFLCSHFRYPTMNSWNRATSYACNLKIHNLDLTTEIEDKLYDMLGTQEFFDFRDDILAQFNASHNYRWQAAFNGRSGGYLVLYHGELKSTEYRSYCIYCGQRNYRSVIDSGNICGVCRKPQRMDYTIPPKQSIIYPGRGLDMDEDFEEWSLSELQSRVKLVQELDSLADDLIGQAVQLATTYDIVEEEFYIPQTRHVLVAK